MLTFLGIESGYLLEFNPLMSPVMELPFWISFTIKNAWTALMLAFLLRLRRAAPATVDRGLKLISFCYGLLMLYHGIILAIINIGQKNGNPLL